MAQIPKGGSPLREEPGSGSPRELQRALRRETMACLDLCFGWIVQTNGQQGQSRGDPTPGDQPIIQAPFFLLAVADGMCDERERGDKGDTW